MLKKPAVRCAALAACFLSYAGVAWGQADACGSATRIIPGVYAGNTNSATNDGVASCVGSLSRDQWFSITPESDQLLVVTTCGAASWDTVLSIHTGCPGNASNAVACNDDSCGLQSRTSVAARAGQTYLIRVGAYGSQDGGPYTLTVSYEDPPPPPSRGPDVWIARFTDVAHYATVGGIASYAIGTDACNMGDFPAEWQADNNLHPVIAQNIFRLKDGRFEQIGQSWLKHGFSSTNSATCGTCQPPPNGGSQLGPNCSDAYGSGLNGSQGNLGPRSQVNPTTGVFPFPFSAPGWSGQIARRIQVRESDVLAAQNPGALYFGECQYVTQDDAQWGNGNNNNSYQRMVFNGVSGPSFTGSFVAREPAIHAWRASDPTVALAPMDYTEPNPMPGRPPIVARFWVAGKATDNGNGTWNYEYAVQNLTSNRAGGAFTVPLPTGANVSNVGFSGIPSHSGEPWDNSPWIGTVTPFGITFRPPAVTPAQNANALRWGTLYNFRFTSNVPPATGDVTVSLFTAGPVGSASAVSATVTAPDLYTCIGDFNHDGGFDGADIASFYDAFEAGVPSADVNRDGGVDGSDVEVFFTAWADGRC